MQASTNMEYFSTPNGQLVSCVSRHSAAAIWHELGATIESWHVSDLSTDDIVFDVGAHVGLASLRLAQLAGIDLRIIACEPAPPSYVCLKQNVAWHLPGSRALNVAVGTEPGVATLSYYPRIETMSTVYVDEADDKTNVGAALSQFGVTSESERARYWNIARSDVKEYRVPVTTLAEIATTYGVGSVGLIKIDVERAEFDVLRGMGEYLWSVTRNIVAEVHDIDGRLADVVSVLSDHGYAVTHFQPPLLAGATVHMVVGNKPRG